MIKIENLDFSYGKHPIYKDFNLTLNKGEVTLITGINGMGKSTLLRLIAGVLRPQKGSIRFSEEMGSVPKKKIGFISDTLSMYEGMKVRDTIRFHRSVYGYHTFDDALIRHTKIRMDQKVKELSIGQRVLLHLSLILSSGPELLLIDEVIHSIDVYLREVFLKELIKLLSERSISIVMVNLNFHDIEHMLDRVILLREGAVAVDEPIDSLKSLVKKVSLSKEPQGIPVLFQTGCLDYKEYYIYPFSSDHQKYLEGPVTDLNLSDIIKAFIGGEYAA